MTEIQILDNKFSNFVRARAGWCCESCHKKFISPTIFLQCAHFIRRGHKATRFDPRNAVALCVDCHKFFDGAGKNEFAVFMKKLLGAAQFAALELLGKTIKKESEAIAEARAWL